jgi:hypothetical protein
VQSEETSVDLRAVHRHGWSNSALARRFGLNRRTLAREVAAAGPRPYPPRAAKHQLTPAQLAHIERRLLVYPVLRATHRGSAAPHRDGDEHPRRQLPCPRLHRQAEAQGRRCYGCVSPETFALLLISPVHFPCSPTPMA